MLRELMKPLFRFKHVDSLFFQNCMRILSFVILGSQQQLKKVPAAMQAARKRKLCQVGMLRAGFVFAVVGDAIAC